MEAFPDALALPVVPAKPFITESNPPLRAMVRRSHSRALIAIAFDWAVIGAVAVACERFRIPALYIVAVVAIARQMNALFELHHHAIHGNLFRRKEWNVRLQILYSIPLGLTIGSERTITWNTTARSTLLKRTTATGGLDTG